jgi:ABC-type methionine transport system ATPase subunit
MIRLENIHKRYHTRHGAAHVLNDVNLTVRPGERWASLGATVPASPRSSG